MTRSTAYAHHQLLIDTEIQQAVNPTELPIMYYLPNGEMKLGGAYNRNGQKEGKWRVILFWDKLNEFVYHEGEFINGDHSGLWNIYSSSLGLIGTGTYLYHEKDELGYAYSQKEDYWEEITDQFYMFQNQLYYIKYKGNYIKQLQDGQWIIEDSNKKQLGYQVYNNGKRIGKQRDVQVYVSTSKITIIYFEGDYKDNVKQGHWQYLDEQNQKLGGGMYKNDQKIGEWIDIEVQSSYKNEIIYHHKQYKKGVQVGKCDTKDRNNKIIGGGKYYEGQKKWKWVEPIIYNSASNRIVVQYHYEYSFYTEKKLVDISQLNCAGFMSNNFKELRIYSTAKFNIKLYFTQWDIHPNLSDKVKLMLQNQSYEILDDLIYDEMRNLQLLIDVDCQHSLIYITKGALKGNGRQIIECIYYEDCVNDIARQEIAGGEIVNGFKHGQFTEKVIGLNSREVLITSGEYQNGIKHGKWVQKIISMHHQTKEIGEGVYENGVKKDQWVEIELKDQLYSSQGYYYQNFKLAIWTTKVIKGYDQGFQNENIKQSDQEQQLQIEPQVKQKKQQTKALKTQEQQPKQQSKKTNKVAKLKQKQQKVKI